jgi:predicted ArsR family transcriptional regulator
MPRPLHVDQVDFFAPLGRNPTSGRYTRATVEQIAEANRTTIRTVWTRVRAAERDGIVRRQGTARAAHGRPPILFALTQLGREMRGEDV